jgi:iron(II)-dependent oxidoreductase
MQSKTEIESGLDAAHRRILALIESLDEARLRLPYHAGINPPVWEGGHAAFFYEVFLLRHWHRQPPLMPGMDNVWDSFDIEHAERWVPGVVPPKGETLDYMRRVHEAVREGIARRALTPEDIYRCRYAICHQYMHVESMIWARQTLGYPPPPFAAPPSPAADALPQPAPRDATIPAGRYRIGMPAGSPEFAARDFAFDNEKPGFDIELPEFRISKTLVSNREFIEFVEDGGYADEAHWSWGGRHWLRRHAAADRDITRPGEADPPRCPIYWRRDAGGWRQRHFDRWQPLALDQPVMHVSYWEAEAWCHWAGRRLPTEYEWEVAALARSAPGSAESRRLLPWGEAMDARRADLDAGALGQVATTALPESDSPFGCRQMIGTAWEWTSSQFLPYDGFAVDVYPYMSTLQFGYHKTVKGGSCATSSALIRGTYRQAYLPQRRDVFVGFRTCARDAGGCAP